MVRIIWLCRQNIPQRTCISLNDAVSVVSPFQEESSGAWLAAFADALACGCVIRLNRHDLLVGHGQTRLAWVCLEAADLGERPLDTLLRLDARLALDAGILIHLDDAVINPQRQETRTRALAALASRLGWQMTGCTPDGSGAGFRLYFRKSDQPSRYRFGMATYSDSPSCLELFERCFKEPAQAEVWRWKYPEGHGASLVALRDDKIVAHYGAMSREFMCFGHKMHALQMGDVMVEPSERGLFTRKGAFQQVACVAQEAHFGYGQRYAFGYGFPNQRAFEMGLRMRLYAEVDQLLELRWSSLKAPFSISSTSRPITSVADHADGINQLWQAMAFDLTGAVIGTRNSDYLRYRYEQHPVFCYQIFMVYGRLTRRPIGVFVLRRDGDVCRLIDLVAPIEVMPEIVTYARRIAERSGAKQLVAWITRSHSKWLMCAEFESSPTGIKVVGNIHMESLPCSSLVDHCWFMMGDTDFM